jgi:hypothetical protein
MNRNSKTTLTRRKGMSKKSLILLAAAAVFALLTSCGDSVVEGLGSKDKTKETGTINVYVRDGVGSKFLDSAEVTLLNGSAPKKTKNGLGVTYENVLVGEYAVRASKPGYSAWFETGVSVKNVKDDYVNYTDSTGGQDIYIPRTAIVNAMLYPLTAKLEGTIRSEINGKKAPVPEGAQLQVVLTNPNIETRIFYTTVEEGGKFAFENLPAVGGGTPAPYNLYALPFEIDGKVYAQSLNISGGASLNPGATSFVDAVAYTETRVVKPLLITERSIVVDTNVAIWFEFDDDLDIDLIGATNVSVRAAKLGYNVEHPVIESIDADKPNKLIITPLIGWGDTNVIRVVFNGLRSKNGSFLARDSVGIQIKGKQHSFTLLSPTPVAVDSTGAIELKFSDDIDTTKVNRKSGIVQTMNSAHNNRIYTLQFKGEDDEEAETDYSTVILKPIAGSTWLDDGFTITINRLLTSVRGNTFFPTTVPANGDLRVYLKSPRAPFVVEYDAANKPVVDSAGAGAVITLTFSDEIDVEKFVNPNTFVTVSYAAAMTPVVNANNYHVAAEGKTIKITPVNPWTGNIFVTVSSSLRSVKGEELANGGATTTLEIERRAAYKPPFNLLGADSLLKIPTPEKLVIADTLASIVLKFSDKIDTSITGLKIEVKTTASPPALEPSIITYNADLTEITIKPHRVAGWSADELVVSFNDLRSTIGEKFAATNTVSVKMKEKRKPVFVYTGPLVYGELLERVSAQAFTLTFSDKIDFDKLNKGLTSAWVTVNPSVGLTVEKDPENDSAIIVTPVGNWMFASDDSLHITTAVDFLSVNNDTITAGNVKFSAARKPLSVVGLAVTGLGIDSVIIPGSEGRDTAYPEVGSLVKLKWDIPESLRGLTAPKPEYEVWRKVYHPGDANVGSLQLVGNASAGDTGLTDYEEQVDGLTATVKVALVEGRNVFVIRAHYDGKDGTLAGDTVSRSTRPTIVSVSGGTPDYTVLSPAIGPYYTYVNTAVQDAIINGDNLDVGAGEEIEIKFSEPMKITSLVDESNGSWNVQSAIKSRVIPSWKDNQTVVLKISVEETTPAPTQATIILTYTLSGLESVTGRPFFVMYDALNENNVKVYSARPDLYLRFVVREP